MKTISKTYPKILPKVRSVQAVSGGSTLPRSGCPLEDHPLWTLAAYTPGPSLVCWDDYGRTLIQKSNPAGDRCDLYIGALTAADGVISGTVAYIPSGTAFTLPFCKMLNEDNVIGARVIAGGVIELVQRLDATWTTVWTSGADAVSVGDLFELIFRGTDIFIRVAGTTLHKYALPAGLQGDGYAGYQQHRFDDADAALVHNYRLSLEVPALEWFVRPVSGAPYGDGSGVNYDNAWGGFADLDRPSILPGDTVYLLGIFDAESSYFSVPTSDDEDNPVIVSGKLEGHPDGIIDGRQILNSTWVDNGDGTWSHDTSGYEYTNPLRLWIDGVEVQEYASLGELTQDGDWYYDSDNTTIILRYSSDPLTLEFKSLNRLYRSVYIADKNNIILENLTIMGGNRICVQAAQVPGGQSGLVIRNCIITNCAHGIQVGTNATSIEADVIKDVFIHDNLIDSGYRLINTDVGGGIGTVYDGISIRDNVVNAIILNNKIVDFGHNGINIDNLYTDCFGVFDIEVAYNEVIAPDIFYGRALGIACHIGGRFNIHHNLFYDCPTANQVSIVDSTIAFNYFAKTRYTMNDNGIDENIGIGLNMYAYVYNGLSMPFSNVLVVSNTFDDIYDAGINVSITDDYSGTVENIVVADNLLNNCAQYNTGDYVYSFRVKNSENIIGVTVQNNSFYSDKRGQGSTNEIRYRGNLMSVADFNEADYGADVIVDNLDSDSMLDGFHIPITSPAYEAGIWIPDVHAGAVDIDGDPVDEPVSIGCDEGEEVGTVFYNGQKITHATEVVTYSDAVLTVIASERGTISGQGIDCGSDCETTLPLYGGVELTASANLGYYFHSWIGEGLYTGDNPLLLVLPGEDYTIRPVFGELVDTETPCMTSPTTPLGIASTNVHYDDGTYNLEGWKGMSCTAVDAYDCWCTPIPTEAADLPVWLDWREASATPMTPTRFRIRPRAGMSGSWYPTNNPKEISLSVIHSDGSETEVFRIVNENWNDASAREWTVDTTESGVGIRLYIHSTQGYDDGGDFHTCVGDFHVWGTYPGAPEHPTEDDQIGPWEDVPIGEHEDAPIGGTKK